MNVNLNFTRITLKNGENTELKPGWKSDYIDNHRWTMRVFHKIRDRERQ